ncbi:hypothetical protein NX794_30950 [Streptomyces sp. LP11]|uniref:Uncharacterized protein n=1 Tax=Streptomyces pyxinicus TaxID=2970331 RepID=A0ABT2BAN2_9ACTN|nr:hypothetical protein [Streptomyces sp. LP11]MCS0605589.1 hypothetical protein [Streptomyces sp. LP11]
MSAKLATAFQVVFDTTSEQVGTEAEVARAVKVRARHSHCDT